MWERDCLAVYLDVTGGVVVDTPRPLEHDDLIWLMTCALPAAVSALNARLPERRPGEHSPPGEATEAPDGRLAIG